LLPERLGSTTDCLGGIDKYNYHEYVNDRRSTNSRDIEHEQIVYINGQKHKMVPLRTKSNSRSPSIGTSAKPGTYNTLGSQINRGSFANKSPDSMPNLSENHRVSNVAIESVPERVNRLQFLGTITETANDQNTLSYRAQV